MGSGIFGIGVSGLLVARRGLATTSHNISNANTPGYSRQRADFASRPPQVSGEGFIGTGVQVSAISRVVDDFVSTQLRDASSAVGDREVFFGFAAQVDNVLADPDAGLAPTLAAFFDAMNEVADDPSSVPARQVLVSEGEGLVQRFHALDGRLTELRLSVNQQLDGMVQDINGFSLAIADINQRIVLGQGHSQGKAPNDLLDQRDELVRELSVLVNVHVLEQSDGSINVTTGTGQVVVAGTRSIGLSAVRNTTDPSRSEIGYNVGSSSAQISDLISGGELKGMLDFRTQILDTAHNALGRIALGVSSAVNTQHRLGSDLDGQLGGDFFSDLTVSGVSVLADTNNTGAPAATISAVVKDIAAVTDSAYRLDRTGAAYTLTRLDNNAVTTLTTFPTAAQTIDGVELSLSAGTIADGDYFLIEPVRNASQSIAMVVPNTRAIAAAAPIIGQAATANTGSGEISLGAANSVNNAVAISFTAPAVYDVVDATTGATLATGLPFVAAGSISFNGWTTSISGAPAAGDSFTVTNTVTAAAVGNTGTGVVTPTTIAMPDPNLTDSVTITFDTPASTFTVTGATTGTPTAAVAYTAGQPVSFNGWTATIQGTPSAGDTFTIGPNSSGVGDNRNALLLADLRTVGTLDGGASSFNEAYGVSVAKVGTLTRQAEIGLGAQQTLLTHVEETRSSVSGVNLDEEAANLLRYQQLFQASAQVISAADAMFQSLMSAVGR